MKPKYRKQQNYLDSLQAIDKEQAIKIEGEKGLVLRIFKSGRKIFYYYYTDADNIRRKHKIGLFDPTGVDGYWLERAIDEADRIRGTDPRQARIEIKYKHVN